MEQIINKLNNILYIIILIKISVRKCLENSKLSLVQHMFLCYMKCNLFKYENTSSEKCTLQENFKYYLHNVFRKIKSFSFSVTYNFKFYNMIYLNEFF